MSYQKYPLSLVSSHGLKGPNRMRKIWVYSNPKRHLTYPNEYYEDNGELVIRITHGRLGTKDARFDMEDIEILKRCNWQVRQSGRTFYVEQAREGKVHRLLTNCPSGLEIDHVNGNGLDNRKSNLRITDHKTNMQNQVGRTSIRHRNRGVHRWDARWAQDGKQYSKSFATKEEAESFRRVIEEQIYRRPLVKNGTDIFPKSAMATQLLI